MNACAVRVWVLAHEIKFDAEPLEALEIQQRIVSHRRHDQRVGTQEPQVVGYVACTAARTRAHSGNERPRSICGSVRQECSGSGPGHHDFVYAIEPQIRVRMELLQIEQIEAVAGRLERRGFDVEPGSGAPLPAAKPGSDRVPLRA